MRSPRPSGLFALLLAAVAVAQEPVPDPNLPNQLKDLRAYVKNPKMEDDLRAHDLIGLLTKEPAKRHARDLDKIADGVAAVFKTGKVRPPDQSRLYDTAAEGLAQLGARGSRGLRAAFEDERFKGRDYEKLRARLIDSLGKGKDPTQVEFLLEVALRSPDDLVMAAAGQALGNFTEMDAKQTREVVKRLIARFGEWAGRASELDQTDANGPINVDSQNAKRTLAVLREPWNATLAKLTGESFSEAAEWQRWLNKNRDWQPGRKN